MNLLIVQCLLSYIWYFIKFSEKRFLLDPIEEFLFQLTGGNAVSAFEHEMVAPERSKKKICFT